MSSHREAPESSKDPVADNTDVYAFVSPDRPDTVTLIANFIPFEYPAGGPNFYEFGDDVSYRIKVDNDGSGRSSITYEFRFETMIKNKNTFLYNTGPITSLGDENFNRPQTYRVFRWVDGEPELLGVYDGTPLTERGDWYAGSLPDRITIFRFPTLRICDTEQDVVEEVEITVVHEIAHHFGIDDERLHDLGYA